MENHIKSVYLLRPCAGFRPAARGPPRVGFFYLLRAAGWIFLFVAVQAAGQTSAGKDMSKYAGRGGLQAE